MKHLKIYENFEYSEKLNNKIKNSKPLQEYTMYMIGLPSDDDTILYSNREQYTDFELAIKSLEIMNKEWSGDNGMYCLFESKTTTKILSEDEINLRLNANKYNI